MVAPHPTPLRKLRNTANIAATGKAELVHGLQSKYPQDNIISVGEKSW